MSSPDPLAVLEVASRNELESLLMDFDGNWDSNSLSEYGAQVATHPDEQYRTIALAELVKIDIQRQWSAGKGQMLDDYLRRFPSLGNAESISSDLIAAEYEARLGVDPETAMEAYELRFPRQFQQFRQLASRLMDSSGTGSAWMKRTEKELNQASIDTSRVDQLRDTHAGKGDETTADLPIEFGRYRILKQLGAGAMGKVYLAHDSQLDRHVALKTPSFSDADDNKDMVTRFYREARAAAKIHHRNICPIYDVGEIDGRHFITMAFIKGRCMSDFIKPDRLPPQRTSAILVQRLAVALAEAHKHNVIHRDLKPANIMIDLKKEPIVMDFGLARQMDVESRVTQSGMAVGTPAYMSPEQIRGELDEVGPTADIYALGVILYELLTGQLPFRGPIAKVVYAIVNDAPASLSKLRPDVDAKLEAICAKMMAKTLEERYSSMSDVAIALKQYVKSDNPSGRVKVASAESDVSRPKNPDTSSLTETGALNAFFAAQADADSLGTQVEPASKLPAVSNPAARPVASRPNRNKRGRKALIATGFIGGIAFLLGVIIYFKGGKIELDDDSDAVVKVDGEGNVTIRPGSETKLGVPMSTKPTTESTPGTSMVPTGNEMEPGFVSMFPSNNLDDWNGLSERWGFENAELEGSAPQGVNLKTNTVLCSGRNYQDFELRFEAILEGAGRKDGPNSGIQFRSRILDRTHYKVGGPQLDIGGQFWGGLWGENTTGLMFRPDKDLVTRTVDRQDWNRYRLRVEGDRVVIHINDTQIVDREFPGIPKEGIIGFQLHRGKIMSVRFKNVRIKELPSEPRSTVAGLERQTKSAASDLSRISPKPQLLNEWEHGWGRSPNWHLASLSPDGSRVAFRIGDGPLKISDTNSKKMLEIPSEMEDAFSLAFSADGRLIATGHSNKKIRLWDAESFAPVGEPFESPIEQRVLWVHLSADGSKLIAMGNDHSKLKNMSTFFTWEVSSGKLISRFQARMDEQKWADSIDASADGRLVAVISLRDGPALWDTTTGEQDPVEFQFDEKLAGMTRITGMDLSADGSRLAYGTLWGGSSYAAILDTSTGKELWRSGKQKGRVHCVQFTNDGKWLASTAGRSAEGLTKAHQLSLWNTASGAEVGRWMYKFESDNANYDRIKFLSFSDDGSRLLLAGGYMPVVVWNLYDKPDAEANSPTVMKNNAVEPTFSDQPIPIMGEATPAESNVAAEPTSEPVESPTSALTPVTRAADPDMRAAAQRILDVGGRLGFIGTRGWIYRIPEGEFRINNIEFVSGCRAQDEDIALLTRFPELETVTFWSGQVTDTGFKELAKLKAVKSLRFYQGCGIGDEGLAAISKLTQLTELSVYHTRVTNDGLKVLADFPSLRYLMLGTSFKQNESRTHPAFITDEGLAHLSKMKHLNSASITGPRWTDAAGEHLGRLTNLTGLTFGSPHITDDGIKPLENLSKLRGLSLYTPKVTDEGLAKLRTGLNVQCKINDRRNHQKYQLNE